MPTYAPPAARCDVFTFKEGLLSAVGHDVKLTVQRFTVTAEGGAIEAAFEAGSLSVVAAMRDGVENPGALSDKDRRTIEGYVREDVLHSRRYPKITFRSESIGPDDDEEGAIRVEGELTLHGRTRTVAALVRREGDQWVTRLKLHQPDFGIKPFRAMLGALRIQADVEVALSVPVEGVEL
jgi:hypothetical protein